MGFFGKVRNKLLARLRVLLDVARKARRNDVVRVVAAASGERRRVVTTGRIFGEPDATVDASVIVFTEQPAPLLNGMGAGCFSSLRCTSGARRASVLWVTLSPLHRRGVPALRMFFARFFVRRLDALRKSRSIVPCFLRRAPATPTLLFRRIEQSLTYAAFVMNRRLKWLAPSSNPFVPSQLQARLAVASFDPTDLVTPTAPNVPRLLGRARAGGMPGQRQRSDPRDFLLVDQLSLVRVPLVAVLRPPIHDLGSCFVRVLLGPSLQVLPAFIGIRKMSLLFVGAVTRLAEAHRSRWILRSKALATRRVNGLLFSHASKYTTSDTQEAYA